MSSGHSVTFAGSIVNSLQYNDHNYLVSFSQELPQSFFTAIPMSIGAPVSIFFCFIFRIVKYFVANEVSNAMRSSLYFSVVPRNLKFDELSCISFLTASIFSSSLILLNLFSNLFVSSMDVLPQIQVWHEMCEFTIVVAVFLSFLGMKSPIWLWSCSWPS